MNYEEFRREILGLNKSRNHKVKNSYGVYDAFRYYRKNRPKEKKYVLTSSQYYNIIRQVNKAMVEELLRGGDVIFPFNMGKIRTKKETDNFKNCKWQISKFNANRLG